MSEWIVLSPSLPGRFDGIGDNAWHLAQALSTHGRTRLVVRPSAPSLAITDDALGGEPVETEVLSSWRDLEQATWRAAGDQCDGVVVHYFPPAFLQRDLLSLLRWLRALRRRGRPVVVAVHEFWPPADGRLRRAGIRAAYQQVLRSLVARASTVVVTHELAGRVLCDAHVARPEMLRVIPVGSNISRAPITAPVIDHTMAMFGQPAGMRREALIALGRWLTTAAAPIHLRWLGRSAEELRAAWCGDYGLSADRVTFEGALRSSEISARLASSSLALAPYIDGASTRRSSLAALVEHGLSLVGLDGPCTDDLLRTSGAFVFSNVTEPAAFVSNVAALVGDADRRAVLSQAATQLFDHRLSWPRIASGYLAALDPAAAGVPT